MVFPYHDFKYILPLPLACRVSAEKSANIFMGIPLDIICCFSLSAFNIFSLNLIFVSLIDVYLGVFHLGFVLKRTLCASGTRWQFPFPC